MPNQVLDTRYQTILYKHCGKSGLKHPIFSLGLWHNFGHSDSFENCRQMVCHAFDLGITHFDLANNSGPPAGSAEENFGRNINNYGYFRQLYRHGKLIRKIERVLFN